MELRGASRAPIIGPALDGTNGFAEIRDTDTGNRARVRYFNQISDMGWDMVADENGVEQPVEWFGYRSAFEVEFGIAGGAVPADVATFVRDAVLAICPSAGASTVAAAPLEPTGSATLYRLNVGCPEVGG